MLRRVAHIRRTTYKMALPVDPDKIDQAVLALLSLGRHEGNRTWKSFDRNVMAGWQSPRRRVIPA